jgi:hypothetical protein
VAGVASLERLTISSPPIEGVVLRYGHLYGPGTGTSTADAPALHVDAVRCAALRLGHNMAAPRRVFERERFDPRRSVASRALGRAGNHAPFCCTAVEVRL